MDPSWQMDIQSHKSGQLHYIFRCQVSSQKGSGYAIAVLMQSVHNHFNFPCLILALLTLSSLHFHSCLHFSDGFGK